MKKLLFIASILVLGACGPKWQPLFNGENLDGWSVVTGEAPYFVEDGCIVT